MTPKGNLEDQRINGQVLTQLDPLLEHKYRLSACVMLVETESITFSRFKELFGATSGNLGAQLRKLEDAGYVDVRKEFIGRQPTTWYSLTTKGKQALRKHLAVMQSFIATLED
ncbi:MAG: transcriptional regulator [Verrucomicrobiota bacterium]